MEGSASQTQGHAESSPPPKHARKVPLKDNIRRGIVIPDTITDPAARKRYYAQEYRKIRGQEPEFHQKRLQYRRTSYVRAKEKAKLQAAAPE